MISLSRLALASVVAAGLFMTTAHPSLAANPNNPNAHRAEIMKQLNLTPAQKAEIKPLMKSQRTQVEAIKSNTSLTPQQKRQQIRQVTQSTLAQVRSDLTPAQQQTLDSLIAQAKENHQAGRNRAVAP